MSDRLRPELHVSVAALSAQAILPQKAHPTDAGFDLAIPSDHELAPQAIERIDLEFALELPPGWYGQIFGRSSVFQKGLAVHPGVIDADYRGSIQILMTNLLTTPQFLHRGDRIAQMLVLPVPQVVLSQVSPEVLSTTHRGSGGIGSTGR